MAYSAANYQLKYRWSGYDRQKRAVQLDIYEKSATAFTLTYIGGLQSIRLSHQGGQSSMTAPVIKTSLSFTLIDAPDQVEAGYKYGNWQEFYTPDSTKYLVKLYRTHGSTLTLDWQGYITPDSWQEGLDYRGSITITARDNIGHLQDFSFDMAGDDNGLVQISALVTAALNKVDFPMTLEHPITDDAKELRDSDGAVLVNSYVNVVHFKDGTWLAALEDVLEAIGYCLRYVGSSKFVLEPIRSLPLFETTSLTTARGRGVAIEFYGGDRSNDPAYREIKEKVSYGAEMEISFDVFKNLAFSNSSESYFYDCKYYKPSTEAWPTFNNRHWANSASGGSSAGGWLSGGGFLYADLFGVTAALKAQDGEQALHLGVGLMCGMPNNYGSTSVRPTYRIASVGSTDVTLTLEFARPVTISGRGADNKVAPLAHYMYKAAYYICYTDPSTSTKYYWNGTNWQAAAYLLETTVAEGFADGYSFNVVLKDISDMATLGGSLDIEFANFYTAGEVDPTIGAFVRLTAIKAKINAGAVLKSDTITTVNNTNYNVKVERHPVVGAMSVSMPVFSPSNYPGALWKYSNGYVKPYGYANYWRGFNAATAIPLPAQIHKQLLCFNHISLSVLEGTFGSVDKSHLVAFGNEFTYKGHRYLLLNGTLDVLLDRMTGAILHEYIWYDDLWDETNNPSYSGTPTYDVQSVAGAVASGGSSSGGGGGGTGDGTVTSVAVTVPPGLQVTGSPITTNGTIAIALAEGYTIPLASDVTKGVTAYGWGDHRQAGYLTGITSQMVVNALGFTPTANTGTVTSIKVTTPTGLRVSNGTSQTITGSGTFAITLQSGYAIPTTESVNKGVAAYNTVEENKAFWTAGTNAANAAFAAAVTNRVDNASDITDNNYNLVTANAIFDKFNGSSAFMPVVTRTSNYNKIADNATGDTYLATAGAIARYVQAAKPTALNDLTTDVSISGPSNGDFFCYSSSLGKWTNITASNLLQTMMGSTPIGGQQSGSGMYRPIYWGGSSFIPIPAGSVASGNNYPVSGNEVYTHFLNTAASMSVDTTSVTSSQSKVPTSYAVLQYVGKITDASTSTWQNNTGCLTGAAMYGFLQESALMPVSKYADTTALPTAAANDGYFNVPSSTGSGNPGDNHLATCSLIYKYIYKHWWGVKDFTPGAAASKGFTTSVTSGSADLVTSGAVYTAIRNYYTNTISYDKSSIEQGTTELVTGSAVLDYVQTHLNPH